MIALLLVLATAHADPTTRLTAGFTAGADSVGEASVRGSLDYGVARGLILSGELGTLPGRRVAGGVGPLLAVHTRWWRVGLVAMPELSTGLDARAPQLGARVGGRVNWLAFWGVSVTGRVDQVWTPRGAGQEAGLGLSVRL